MKRKIKVSILTRDPFTSAYIKDRLRDDPIFTFCEATSPDVNAFIVEQPLLTPTQQKILQALADFGSVKTIAKQLNYHPATVRRHLCRIYERLKVKNAPQAVAVGIRLRLIK